MFTHNINPILVSIGPLNIYYYSLAYIIGFVLAYWFLTKAAKNKTIKGLNAKIAEDFVIYLIVGVILGGRLGHFLFYNISVFWSDPLEILKLWHGGMAFHGSLIGVLIAYYFFQKKYSKIQFYDLADLLVIPVAFALFLGRIANFINGELWGTITNVPWCVKFKDVEGCRHPSQLYESLYTLVIFFILLFAKTRKQLKRGILFWGFIGLYGLFRFIVNFWRDVDRLTGQILSLLMLIVAVYFIWKINHNN